MRAYTPPVQTLTTHPGFVATRTVLLLAVLFLAGCRPSPSVFVLDGTTMGTNYQVRIADPGVDRDRLATRIDAELEEIDRQMSTWREDSEISALNRHRDPERMAVSPAFGAVVQRAVELSAATDGAFDVTLRPLAVAWGFQGGGEPRVPDEEELAALRERTGMTRLVVESGPGGVRIGKTHPDLQVDLSAIAKGYGVDRLAALVREAGGENFLVEIGGEVRTGGERPGGGPWRVAVERSDGAPRSAAGAVLLLDNVAVATSGDYINYFERDGRHYGHVLDPATGRPVEHGTVAATVVAGDTATADALATAFLVLAPDRAFEVAGNLDVGLRLEIREGERLVARTNAAFDRRLAKGD